MTDEKDVEVDVEKESVEVEDQALADDSAEVAQGGLGEVSDDVQDEPSEANPLEVETPEVKETIVPKQRQWVTLRGASMDARTGWGNRADMAHDLRSVLGKPHGCALVHEPAAPAELIEFFRCDLMAEGFEVSVKELPGDACNLDAVAAFDAALAEAGITSDDLVVTVGREVLISVATFACQSWCGGVPLAVVPLSLSAAAVAAVTPRALDLGGRARMLNVDGSARFQINDLEIFDLDPASEEVKFTLATMAAIAFDDTDKALGRVWDAAADLVACDPQALADALTNEVKSRGRVVSSSALATRQSIEYGTSFMYALSTLVGPDVPRSVMFADGLRFSARLAVAQEIFSIDDMFTQDELLEKLGLGTVEVSVDPDALVEALKAERFSRSRRFMLALPRAVGRVRLAAIEDDMLREHVAAWCGAR